MKWQAEAITIEEEEPLRLRLSITRGRDPTYATRKIYLQEQTGRTKGQESDSKGCVIHHANTMNPERCFVRLFKKYAALCSKTENKNPDAPFYLKPLAKPTE